MGTIKHPKPVKLVLPMLSADVTLFREIEPELAARWGPLDYRSPPLPFGYTDYYAHELGAPISRIFVAFERLIDPARLAEIKCATNALEQTWAVDGRRRINLDPGYLTQAKLVLATTKDQAHRIYVGQGIYAEVTLSYRDGAWLALPWTYPDYRSAEYLRILNELHRIYVARLRETPLCA